MNFDDHMLLDSYSSDSDSSEIWRPEIEIIKKSRSYNDLNILKLELNGKSPNIKPIKPIDTKCQICFTNNSKKLLNCKCNMFCEECLGKSFESQVDLKGTNIIFKCPNTICNNIISNEIV